MLTDPIVQSYLQPGEQLLWWGRPDLQHARSRNRVLKVGLIHFGICAIFGVIVGGSIGSSSGNAASALGIFFLVTVGLFLVSAARLWRRYALLFRQDALEKPVYWQHTHYVITNIRAFIATAVPGQPMALVSRFHHQRSRLRVTEDASGWGDIWIGRDIRFTGVLHPSQLQRIIEQQQHTISAR